MRETPRVVFVLSAYALGGAERQLAALIEHRPASAAHLDVRTITFLAPSSDRVAERYRRAGVVDTLIDRQSQGFPLFFSKLVWTMARLRPDIVHTFLDSSPGAWGRLAAWLVGVPVIAHSDRLAWPEGTRVHLWLRPFLDRKTARFFPNAGAIADRLVRDGVPRERISLNPSAVDLGTFVLRDGRAMRGAWGVSDDAVVAGFLGRFVPNKRLDLLLDALLLLPQDERPDLIVLGGDGPTRAATQERVAADPWLSAHCLLPGVVDAIPDFMAGIDYLILPSDVEGLPNAVLEAMAMARPVVATGVSDVPRLIEGIGFVAEPGEPASLAGAVRAMQRLPPAERRRLGAQARRRIERDYDMVVVARRFWEAHLDLLASTAARRTRRTTAS